MSRAFVRENDGDDVLADLPERPVSPHPNFVTARGLHQIEGKVRELGEARERARERDDKVAAATIDRDLRYWLQRRSSARLVEPGPSPDKVRFGVHVIVRYVDGEERDFTLVGEDEAEPAAGLISWISPVGQTLLGHEAGDEIEFQGRRATVEELGPPANR